LEGGEVQARGGWGVQERESEGDRVELGRRCWMEET
jgi:hypothetical protein